MPPTLSSRSRLVALTKSIAGMVPSWIGTLYLVASDGEEVAGRQMEETARNSGNMRAVQARKAAPVCECRRTPGAAIAVRRGRRSLRGREAGNGPPWRKSPRVVANLHRYHLS